MNWKNISENWQKFTDMHHLIVEKNERNYFYGKQNICQAKEKFNDFEIFYEYKFNKSANYGSSFNLGHKMMIVIPVELTQNGGLKMRRNSLWNRWIKRKTNININAHRMEVKGLLPLADIENLMKTLTDLEISIESFNRYQNPNIKFGQKVVLMESKYHPTELKQFELSRTITIALLEELIFRKIIKASTQHSI